MPLVLSQSNCITEKLFWQYLSHYEYAQQPQWVERVRDYICQRCSDARQYQSLNSITTSAFEWALLGQTKGNPPSDPTADILNCVHDEMIDFKEDPSLHISPSFNQTLHEEMLQEEDQSHVIWATLKLNIPANHQPRQHSF